MTVLGCMSLLLVIMQYCYVKINILIGHTCLYNGENVAAFSNTEDELNTGHTAKANGILK